MNSPLIMLQGYPARITPGEETDLLLSQTSSLVAGPVRCPGLVVSAGSGAIILQLFEPLSHEIFSWALVEVLHPDGLYRFSGEMTVDGTDRTRVKVALPTEPEFERIQRRQNPRVIVSVPAWITVGEKQWQALATNLSVGGAALVSAAQVQPGQRIQVGFGFGHGLPPGPLHGRVARLGPAAKGSQSIGVVFVNVPADVEALLAQHVSQRHTESLQPVFVRIEESS